MLGKKRWWFSIAEAAVLLSLAPASDAQQFTSFDPSGSNNTLAQAINSKGQITGYYRTDHYHGFVREPDGTIAAFDVTCPLPDCIGPQNTQPFAINSSGQIAGTFLPVGTMIKYHGFLRQADGTFTAFDVPNAIFTWATALNSKGQITGYAVGLTGAHGFLRQPDGTITSFDVPGANDTVGAAINSEGQIAGYYRDSKGHYGFLREPDGAITTFEAPFPNLFIYAMNSEGQIVGDYGDSTTGNTHGFLRRRDGQAVTFDGPNSVLTFPDAINSHGQITGSYALSLPTLNSAKSYGFLRSPNGTITSFDGPPGTLFIQPRAINSQGQIAGYYSDAAGQLHGFLRSCGSDDGCDE